MTELNHRKRGAGRAVTSLRRAAGAAAVAACCAVSFGWASQARAADCASMKTSFDEALGKRDIATAETVERKIAVDALCSAYITDVQRRLAGLQVVMADALKNDPSRQQERLQLLTKADKPGVNWIAAYALGDLHFTQRRYAPAAEAFERAIEIVKNPSSTPKPPSKVDIQSLLSRASQAKILAANEENEKAPVYVTAAKDHRDGTVGGSFSPEVRGVRPTSVPLPINFETGQAKFTELGEKAASELADAIAEQQPQIVMLSGHTDERGEDDYNMRLSKLRVEAVVHYLTQRLEGKKISLQFKSEWHGKRSPVQIDDTTGLRREDIWALNRRVEWKRQ
jgi:outer membrane protein OmpA-like peptidoglycan-associated protein